MFEYVLRPTGSYQPTHEVNELGLAEVARGYRCTGRYRKNYLNGSAQGAFVGTIKEQASSIQVIPGSLGWCGLSG